MPLILRRPLSAPHFSPMPLILRRLLSAPSFGRHFSAMPLILRRPPERPSFGPHSQQCPSFYDAPEALSFLTNASHFATPPERPLISYQCPSLIFVNGEWGVRYLLVTSPHSLVVNIPIRTSFLTNAPHLRLPPERPLIRTLFLTNTPHTATPLSA